MEWNETNGLNPAPIPIGVRLPQDTSRLKGKQTLSLFDGYPDPSESKPMLMSYRSIRLSIIRTYP